MGGVGGGGGAGRGRGACGGDVACGRRAAPLARYIAAKGSITVNGVSLTVNAVNANHFSVNIVPHTMSRTTLGALQPGDAVNLEVDLIARYLERLLNTSQQSGGLTLETLQKHGY